jgi:hypothetical protein
MSSQVFHRTLSGCVQKITIGERFESQILESFDLVSQELYRLLPVIIHTQELEGKIEID